MFNTNKIPQKTKAMERNVIAKNTTIVGDIKSDGDFRIDGALNGTLTTNGRVIIGAEGSIKGKVEATNADIEGTFSGEPFSIKHPYYKSNSKHFGRSDHWKAFCRTRSIV